MVFLNVGVAVAPNVTCDASCMAHTGLVGQAVTVRDLWKHQDIGVEAKLATLEAKNLSGNGGHLMLMLTPKKEDDLQKK